MKSTNKKALNRFAVAVLSVPIAMPSEAVKENARITKKLQEVSVSRAEMKCTAK
jgi:hypothetical protein